MAKIIKKQTAAKLGPNFTRLVIANSINRFGDSIETLALSWLVYNITGSAFWSAFYFTCKKRVMIQSDILRGILVVWLVAMYYLGISHPAQTIIFTLFISTIEAFRVPAGASFVPAIVEKENLDKAISQNSSISKVAELIGLGVAGVITAAFGVGVAMIIDMLTFFLSALFISTIKLNEEPAAFSDTSTPEKIKNYRDLFIEGLRYSRKTQIVRNLILFVVILNGLMAPLNSLLVPLISGVFGLSSITHSSVSILLSIGMIIGAAVFPYFSKKVTSDAKLIGFNGISLGAIYIIIYVAGTRYPHSPLIPYGLSAIGFLLGFNIAFISTRLTVSFMKQVDKMYLSRVSALFNAFGSASLPITLAIISLMTLKISVPTIFLIFGLTGIVVMGVAMVITEKAHNDKREDTASESQE